MNSPELIRQRQKLDWLIGNTTQAANAELELQAHWAQYLCVRVAGFMENALGEMYSEYARRCANAKVANYVAAAVSAIQNPRAGRFVETARKFDPAWADELEAFLEQEGRKDALNSIMTNRHLIAHGADSGITMARVNEYFEKCIQIVEFVESQCGNLPG